jgi:hypothetical protein
VVRITDETLPIICFQSYGKSTQAEVDMVKPVYQRALRARTPFISLADARFANHAADQRRLWAAWQAEFINSDVHGCQLATVVVLDSTLLRGALLALNWIAPAKRPQHVVADEPEAVEECRALAQRHRLDVPGFVWGKIRLWLEESRRHRGND